ncbi:MAG: hypothetical protein AAB701_02745 [Patescibacteria group bacterium]
MAIDGIGNPESSPHKSWETPPDDGSELDSAQKDLEQSPAKETPIVHAQTPQEFSTPTVSPENIAASEAVNIPESVDKLIEARVAAALHEKEEEAESSRLHSESRYEMDMRGKYFKSASDIILDKKRGNPEIRASLKLPENYSYMPDLPLRSIQRIDNEIAKKLLDSRRIFALTEFSHDHLVRKEFLHPESLSIGAIIELRDEIVKKALTKREISYNFQRSRDAYQELAVNGNENNNTENRALAERDRSENTELYDAFVELLSKEGMDVTEDELLTNCFFSKEIVKAFQKCTEARKGYEDGPFVGTVRELPIPIIRMLATHKDTQDSFNNFRSYILGRDPERQQLAVNALTPPVAAELGLTMDILKQHNLERKNQKDLKEALKDNADFAKAYEEGKLGEWLDRDKPKPSSSFKP